MFILLYIYILKLVDNIVNESLEYVKIRILRLRTLMIND